MRARDAIVVARRRAGLSQQQLADRLGKPQSTIGRWETGATDPRFDDVLATVRACGLELSMGLANADESWVPLIFEQLQRTPTDRLRHLGGADRLDVLVELAVSDVRAIVVGDTAGALHGWPLLLPPGRVQVVVHPDDRGVVAEAGRLRVVEQPAGTLGYSDLVRSAQDLEVGGGRLKVAALIDLLRIALSATDGAAMTWALALNHTLQETARHAAGDIVVTAMPQATSLSPSGGRRRSGRRSRGGWRGAAESLLGRCRTSGGTARRRPLGARRRLVRRARRMRR